MLAAYCKYLIALLCGQRCAVVVYAGLVDVKIQEACSLTLRVLGKVGFERRFVKLVEHRVKVVVSLLDGIVLPLAFDADLLVLGLVHTAHDLVNDRLGEEPLGQPLMRHCGHCSFDIRIAEIFYKRNVGVDQKEI